jgi:hypothetical protein
MPEHVSKDQHNHKRWNHVLYNKSQGRQNAETDQFVSRFKLLPEPSLYNMNTHPTTNMHTCAIYWTKS